jgi:hypothetical protein
MIGSRQGLALIALWLSVAVAVPPSTARIDEAAIPANFKIFARYYPGMSSWKAWKTTIKSDGGVVQEIYDIKQNGWVSRQIPPLTPQDLKDLRAKINKSKFWDLKARYSGGVTDQPTLALVVTEGGKTHEVRVYAMSFLKDEPKVDDFLDVWDEVLRKVPSPNPKQKPR